MPCPMHAPGGWFNHNRHPRIEPQSTGYQTGLDNKGYFRAWYALTLRGIAQSTIVGSSSGQRFASGFLQIPPRNGHPCRPANSSPDRARRGLSPPSGCAMPGTPHQYSGGYAPAAKSSKPTDPRIGQTVPRQFTKIDIVGARHAVPNARTRKAVRRRTASAYLNPINRVPDRIGGSLIFQGTACRAPTESNRQ